MKPQVHFTLLIAGLLAVAVAYAALFAGLVALFYRSFGVQLWGTSVWFSLGFAIAEAGFEEWFRRKVSVRCPECRHRLQCRIFARDDSIEGTTRSVVDYACTSCSWAWGHSDGQNVFGGFTGFMGGGMLGLVVATAVMKILRMPELGPSLGGAVFVVSWIVIVVPSALTGFFIGLGIRTDESIQELSHSPGRVIARVLSVLLCVFGMFLSAAVPLLSLAMGSGDLQYDKYPMLIGGGLLVASWLLFQLSRKRQ